MDAIKKVKQWPIEAQLEDEYAPLNDDMHIYKLAFSAIGALRKIADFGRHRYCVSPNSQCEECEIVQIAFDALNMEEAKP